MKNLLIFVLLGQFWFNCYGIYLTNGTGLHQSATDPAGWTEEGLWGPLLEDWALTGTHREKRVMQLPPAEDSFVMDETVGDSKDVKESKISGGKIVTNPNSKPPGRQISETDLYLLGAMEKLVYRADFMEKRLRRVEEMLYYVMAGNRVDEVAEPCPGNFTRVATSCYLFSSKAGREFDWKVASKQCKRLGGALAEMETIEENQDVVAYIQNNPNLRGKDFWTGGLNPGLLWIWSNSARPVATSGQKNTPNIVGDGRCLRLAYDPALRSYAYRGTDCAIRFSYICELTENNSSNEIRRLGRSKKILNEL